MMKAVSFLTFFVALTVETRAFSLVAPVPATLIHTAATRTTRFGALAMSTTEDVTSSSPLSDTTTAADEELLPNGCHKRDRYIATNRFAVRPNQQAKFEKRWATRKSRLATLDGFKYFHLMRRVKLLDDDGRSNEYDGGYDGNKSENRDADAAQENYISFTVWNKKSDFSTWRKGDAFKEAHGGTSIGAFLSTMVNSALILRGAPRPAFYDSLFLQSNKPLSVPETVDGWRNNVNADGIHTLPAECFVVLTKYFIPRDKAASFEKEWKDKENATATTTVQGFVMSSLMRRDGQAKGHGIKELTADEPTYVACKIFQDREFYEKWTAAAAAAVTSRIGIDSSLCSREPEKVFYEGVLVISSKDGA